MKTVFLSYELSDQLSGYGGGARIEIQKERQMCCGDTSNNTSFQMPTHFGTHLDFPRHFSDEGKTGSEYSAESFCFRRVHFHEVDMRDRPEPIVTPKDLPTTMSPETDALIMRTCFCEVRDQDRYWENGPGFAPEVAAALKELSPGLRLIGFDSISLTNFQNRPLGRIAHKAFLMEHDLLILEDMDLTGLSGSSRIEEMVISPLRMRNSDGAPATVFAKIHESEGSLS